MTNQLRPTEQQLEAVSRALKRREWRGPSYYLACAIYYSMFTLLVVPAIVVLNARTDLIRAMLGSIPVLVVLVLPVIADVMAFRRRQAGLNDDILWDMARHVREERIQNEKQRLVKIFAAYLVIYLAVLSLIAIFRDAIVRYAQNGSLAGAALDCILVIMIPAMPLILAIAPMTRLVTIRFFDFVYYSEVFTDFFLYSPWTRAVALILLAICFLVFYWAPLTGLILSDRGLSMWGKVLVYVNLHVMVFLFSVLPLQFKLYSLDQSLTKDSICANSG